MSTCIRQTATSHPKFAYNPTFIFCSPICPSVDATFRHVGQNYSPKNKYFFASFNNDRGLSLDDKTKDYVDRNTGCLVYSLHEVTQLG